MKEKQVKLAAENPHIKPMDNLVTSDLDLKLPANQHGLAIRLFLGLDEPNRPQPVKISNISCYTVPLLVGRYSVHRYTHVYMATGTPLCLSDGCRKELFTL